MYSSQLGKDIKGAIFDMDGLLINSEQLYYEAGLAVIEKDNLPIPKKAYLDIKGYSSDQFKKFYLNFIDEKTFANFMKQTNSYVEQAINSGKLQLMPGVKQLINQLKQAGVKLGIASNNHRVFIEQVLTQLAIRNCFDVILSHEAVNQPKPSPDIYCAAQKKLAIAPSQLIVFEDSGPGIKAANGAGIDSVLVPDLRDATAKERQQATLTLDSLSQFN
ncbi:HAD family phosphatase [Holzapfeliella sp. He02]|uniref:HAD family phosphatase n=1 Tax=Holzapfeliella saturejae TaxID=3082953 RepID=A0ABU8SG05_9LACO